MTPSKEMELELIASLEEERLVDHILQLYLLILCSEWGYDSLDSNDSDTRLDFESDSGSEQDGDEPENRTVDGPEGNIQQEASSNAEAIPQSLRDKIMDIMTRAKLEQEVANWCYQIIPWKRAYSSYQRKRSELEKDSHQYLDMKVGYHLLQPYLTLTNVLGYGESSRATQAFQRARKSLVCLRLLQ